jgi:hypothetical protein
MELEIMFKDIMALAERKKMPLTSQLKKLSKITSDQLFKAWLNRKNPITGYSLEID